jgi:hypothetical protein
MAYTPTYYNAKLHLTQSMGIWSLVRWLVNDQTSVSTTAVAPDDARLVGPAGPGWKLVACRSNGSLYSTRATGSITTIAKALINDNEVFTLDDGLSPVLTFEFNVTGTATIPAASVEVDISADVTADDVRDTIITTINNLKSLITIQASNDGAATVTLENVVPGLSSNTTQSTTVGGAFAITNMTGALQASGDGTMAAITGATNWRDGSLADDDWCVIQSSRRDALTVTTQGQGYLAPDTGASTLDFTINGITLTGVAGARTSGSDDFNKDLGSKESIVDDMVAAINDPANSFAGVVGAKKVTTGFGFEVFLTADRVAHPGIAGNLIDISVTAPVDKVPYVRSSTMAVATYRNASLGSGLTTNEFEIWMLNDESAGRLDTLLMPMTTENGAFDLSTADAPIPVFPSTAYGADLGDDTNIETFTNVPSKYLHVADEGSWTGFFDAGDVTNVTHHYHGSVEYALPAVTKPFVVKGGATLNFNNGCNFIYQESSNGQDTTIRPWRMLNPADDTTLIVGNSIGMAHFGTGNLGTYPWYHELINTNDVRLGSRSILPVGVYFNTLGVSQTDLPGKLFGGWLQNTWSVHNRSGVRGTLNNRAYLWRTDLVAAQNFVPVLIKWDGITRY